VSALIIGGKALVNAAGAVALHYLDHLAVALDIAASLKFRDRLDDRLHLRKDQRGLELIVSRRVAFAARLALGAEQMAQRKTCDETGFAVTARLGLDRDSDLAPTIRRKAAVDRFDEFALTRQQFHSLARQDAFRYWRKFKKRNHALKARKAIFLPRQSARSRTRNLSWLCSSASQAHSICPNSKLSARS
jgi:hypothetical protein